MPNLAFGRDRTAFDFIEPPGAKSAYGGTPTDSQDLNEIIPGGRHDDTYPQRGRLNRQDLNPRVGTDG